MDLSRLIRQTAQLSSKKLPTNLGQILTVASNGIRQRSKESLGLAGRQSLEDTFSNALHHYRQTVSGFVDGWGIAFSKAANKTTFAAFCIPVSTLDNGISSNVCCDFLAELCGVLGEHGHW